MLLLAWIVDAVNFSWVSLTCFGTRDSLDCVHLDYQHMGAEGTRHIYVEDFPLQQEGSARLHSRARFREVRHRLIDDCIADVPDQGSIQI
jgi:hypothetical protein